MGLFNFIEDVVTGTVKVAAGATKTVVGVVPTMVGEDDLLVEGLGDITEGVMEVLK